MLKNSQQVETYKNENPQQDKLAGGFIVQWQNSVPSTNKLVKKDIVANLAQKRCVHAAFEQTAGYGRQGRTWVSPKGGLYASFPEILSCDLREMPSFSLFVSLVIARVLRNAFGVDDAYIKWPNDIVCPQGKLCGISLELINNTVCVGIGINVFAPFKKILVGGKYVPAYVAEKLQLANSFVAQEGLSSAQKRYIQAMLNEIFREYQQLFPLWQQYGFSYFREEYISLTRLIDSFVEIENIENQTVVEGVVLDIDNQGSIVIQQKDATKISFSSGEIHLK